MRSRCPRSARLDFERGRIPNVFFRNHAEIDVHQRLQSVVEARSYENVISTAACSRRLDRNGLRAAPRFTYSHFCSRQNAPAQKKIPHSLRELRRMKIYGAFAVSTLHGRSRL